MEDDRVSARVNGPRTDDENSPRHRREKSPRVGGGLPRGGPSWDTASQLSEGSYRSDDGDSALGDTMRAAVRHPSQHAEYSAVGADLEDSVSEADTGEYWSAEEEDLEQELRALEIDETHVAGGARWGSETSAQGAPVGTRNSPIGDDTDIFGGGMSMAIPEDNGDGVVEIGNSGAPTSIENPRITEQSMRHNHVFEWERSLAAYLWRMVNDEMDDDFKVTLTETRAAPGELPYVEFHVCITVPRILQWIAGRATCELMERCTVDWAKKVMTVQSRTLNWQDKFNVFENSVYAAQPKGSGERQGGTDFYKVLRIEQFMAFPPVWVVNWVRDRWALKSREGRVAVDELCEKMDLNDPTLQPLWERLDWAGSPRSTEKRALEQRRANQMQSGPPPVVMRAAPPQSLARDSEQVPLVAHRGAA